MTSSVEVVSVAGTFEKSVLLTLVCFTSSELDPLEVREMRTVRTPGNNEMPSVCTYSYTYIIIWVG